MDKAIQRLKNNKSAGTDGIPAELFKAAGSGFNKEFHQILLKIWNSEEMPEEWNRASSALSIRKETRVTAKLPRNQSAQHRIQNSRNHRD